ncbi:MAG: hypothetical protein NZ699_02035 [Roseiflexus sp.]|nr:hypothetical protein [Roseiflexus sp.]MCS7287891.1 hypothetical protein [Roseiflexus sp.]MDW8144867.1 hypothetical protein [Roseiflexaceae bacterium]MDW8233038.1 hypothetical protein [Roseiflexaceae bacterium]
MKLVLRLLGVAALVALGIVIYRAVRQYREDSVFDLGSSTQSSPPSSSSSTERRSISPELLAILADPGDKGPVELMRDSEGREWLVNRRNGYRYPIEDGIPIMLLEEGEKNRDESLIIRQE